MLDFKIALLTLWLPLIITSDDRFNDINGIRPQSKPKINEIDSIKCGLSYQMNGFAIVNDFLYQFLNTSVIIYRPPLAKHLNIEQQQLSLENGHYYQLNQLNPKMNTVIQNSMNSIDKTIAFAPTYSYMILTNDSDDGVVDHGQKNIRKYHNITNEQKYLFYKFDSITQNTTKLINYYAFNINTNENLAESTKNYRNPNLKYLMLTKNGKQYVIHNEYEQQFANNQWNGHQYRLRLDSIIFDGQQIGYLCVEMRLNSKNEFVMNLQKSFCNYNWQSSNQFWTDIDLLFIYSDYLYLISKQKQIVYIANSSIIPNSIDNIDNYDQRFTVRHKSFEKFFKCQNYSFNPFPTESLEGSSSSNETSTTMTTNGNHLLAILREKWLIYSIISIIMLIDLICICAIFNYWYRIHSLRQIVAKKWNRTVPIDQLASTTTSRSSLNDMNRNNRFQLSKTMRSKLKYWNK